MTIIMKDRTMTKPAETFGVFDHKKKGGIVNN